MKKLDVVAKGNPVIDLIHTKEGTLTCGGGSSTTVACVAAALGLRSGLIGRIGDDEYGAKLLAELNEYGIDVSRLRTGGETSVNEIRIKYGKNKIDREIFRAYNTDSPEPDKDDYKYIASSRSFYCRASSGYFPDFARHCEKNDVIVFASLQKFCGSDTYDMDALRSRAVKAIIGNEEECKEIDKALSAFVVVTEAERGCTVHHYGKALHFDAYPAKCTDSTGAGDTFAGVFIYGYLKDWNIDQTAKLANRLASACVERYGARTMLGEMKPAGLKEMTAAL